MISLISFISSPARTRVSISTSSAPVYWQRPNFPCRKSRRKESESDCDSEARVGGVIRKEEAWGAQGGGYGKWGRDEEPGDNVMHRGAEPLWEEDEWEGRKTKKQRSPDGTGGGRKSVVWGGCGGNGATGCVHLAQGGRRKIAWARLAGRECLCLIEEGCETKTPCWLTVTGMLPRERWSWTHTHTNAHICAQICAVRAEHRQKGSGWLGKDAGGES